jgi:hypothetical protein
MTRWSWYEISMSLVSVNITLFLLQERFVSVSLKGYFASISFASVSDFYLIVGRDRLHS